MDEQAVTRKAASEEKSATECETITFDTLRFGSVTVDVERVITFPRGLVGMPDASRFTFLHPDEAEGPFFWMQAIDDPALAFVVCDPRSFFPDYNVPIGVEDQETLSLEEANNGVVCVILVIPEDPRQITANLRGPVIINPAEQVGLQLILVGEQYGTKTPLFELPQEGGAGCSS